MHQRVFVCGWKQKGIVVLTFFFFLMHQRTLILWLETNKYVVFNVFFLFFGAPMSFFFVVGNKTFYLFLVNQLAFFWWLETKRYVC